MQIDPRFDEAMRRERGGEIISVNSAEFPSSYPSYYVHRPKPQKSVFDEARKKIDKVRKIDLGG